MEPNEPQDPEKLLSAFQGRSIKSILIFTVMVHAVLLLGTSVPYLIKRFAGSDATEMSEKERNKLAVNEATTAVRKIAEEYGMSTQDLSRKLGGGERSSAAQSNDASDNEESDAPDVDKEDADEPKSAIEKEIEKVEQGPDVPPVAPVEDDEDDLFR